MMSPRPPQAWPARRARGFTVVELMMVVMVAGVLLALAVPSMREFMARQRVKSVNAELVTDLQYARSESVARGDGTTVRVPFRVSNPRMTCYTIHTAAPAVVGLCDCRKRLGTACDGMAGLEELKTVQVLRSTTVTLQPPAAPNNFVEFSGLQGFSNRNDFRVTVASSVSGALRTSTNLFGRPQVCSPDGSIGGVAVCAE